MNILSILGGIISSVPEAISLWNKIAPHVDQHLKLDDATIEELTPMVDVAHAAVNQWHEQLAKAVTTDIQPVK